MKYAAIVTVFLLIACLIGVGAVYMTAHVSVQAVGCIAVEAQTQPELFNSLKEQQATGYLPGTAYTDQPIGKAEDYQFYTYTVRLHNGCFLTADMVELQVTPQTGDVLQIGDDSARALPAQGTGDINATILTGKNMHSVRELNVTYYMWGIPFTLRTAYGY